MNFTTVMAIRDSIKHKIELNGIQLSDVFQRITQKDLLILEIMDDNGYSYIGPTEIAKRVYGDDAISSKVTLNLRRLVKLGVIKRSEQGQYLLGNSSNAKL